MTAQCQDSSCVRQRRNVQKALHRFGVGCHAESDVAVCCAINQGAVMDLEAALLLQPDDVDAIDAMQEAQRLLALEEVCTGSRVLRTSISSPQPLDRVFMLQSS